MTDRDSRTFRLVLYFYDKWRSVTIETDEQWKQFAEEYRQLGIDIDFDHNPLGRRLMEAVLDTISELYRGGMKPVQENYFGRGDMA